VCSSGGASGGSFDTGGNNQGTTGGWNPSTNSGSGPVINNGPSVNTSPILADDDVLVGSTPCDKLYDLIKPYPLGQENPFKQALIANANAVGSVNNEVGQRIRLNGNNQLSIDQITNTLGECNSLGINLSNKFLFGFFHSHPSNCGVYGTNPMFSFEDIIILYDMIVQHNYGSSTYSNGSIVDYNNFVITVAGSLGTFAIKINDKNAFVNNVASFINDSNKLKENKKQFNKIADSSNDMRIKILEKMRDIFGTSLSLYEAKNEFTSWEKLELTNTYYKSTPCNN
jgi:ribosomal protein L7/L12